MGGAHLRLCAVSIDLDEIGCYTAIHGLPATSGEPAHAVYRRALPRLLALFEELSVPLTLFAIGRDLEDERAARQIEAAARSGHEIGNHTLDHHYDFSRRPEAEIRAQIEGGARAIERVTGRAPTGFRAPGYTVTDRVFDALAQLGVGYGSSVFPCPAYYALKLAAITQYRLRGRPTRSIVDHPRVLTAPAEPYRVGSPYPRRGHGLLELPIGVTRERYGRLPYLGTSVVLAGRRGVRALTEAIVGRSLINLVLHGIEGADAHDDDLTALRTHQPDLRIPAEDKLATLRSTVYALRERGYAFVTLADAAAAFA
jgi:peptidoglycan-N-acetylglucosamine deacetylase